MTLEQYAYLSQIIGVVVVVATLIYLSVQVRQGARLLRSESRQALMNNDRDVLLAYLDNTELFGKMAGEEKLSHAEQWRFSVLWIINMRNREHEWFQYQDGVLDEKTWRAYRDIIRVTLGSPRRREWWDAWKNNGFDSDFVQMVDEFIGDPPSIDIMDQGFGHWEQTA